MTNKHTPGPWTLIPNGDNSAVEISEETTVGGVYTGSLSDPLSEADARLISAAPDMISALHCIAMYHDAFPDALSSYERNRVDLAIAKAEGRS